MYKLYITTKDYILVHPSTNYGGFGHDIPNILEKELNVGVIPWNEWICNNRTILQIIDIPAEQKPTLGYFQEHYPELFI